jgi:peptide-methionine (S)-S-oxide reductase
MKSKTASSLLRLAGTVLLAWQFTACAQSLQQSAPAPAVDEPASGSTTETAVLSGGCFWGVQGVYEHVKGVKRAVAGYAGGSAANAHYEIVSTGTTGHAESVQISFDPQQISYGQILQIFFSVAHDPTELNRQGPDEGSQYRSAIFPADEAQRKVAEAYIGQLNKAGVFKAPIVTRTDALRGFYPAEEYHQDFLVNNPHYPYIVFNDLPKVRALKQQFPALYREEPVLALAGPPKPSLE